MNYFDSLKTCWLYNGEHYEPATTLGKGRTGHVVQLETSQRPMAVSFNSYRRTSGALLKEGDVGLIEVEGKPILVRREKSTNGAEYLAEL